MPQSHKHKKQHKNHWPRGGDAMDEWGIETGWIWGETRGAGRGDNKEYILPWFGDANKQRTPMKHQWSGFMPPMGEDLQATDEGPPNLNLLSSFWTLSLSLSLCQKKWDFFF